MPRYRAWRFVHPDFVEDKPAGLRLSPKGRIAMVEEHESVRQAILLLLSTVPGERVMRPEYGCDLHRLVFAVNDDTTAGLAIHYVRRALERWEPRIALLRIDAQRSQDAPGRLDIMIEYRVRDTQRIGSLRYSLSLTGEEG